VHRGAHGTYNVGSGRETPAQHVFDILVGLAGQPASPVERRAGRPLDVARQCADISRLRELGYAPGRSLEDSVGAVLQYYLDDVAACAVRV
jgi:UDP-glucose 4-epimerase